MTENENDQLIQKDEKEDKINLKDKADLLHSNDNISQEHKDTEQTYNSVKIDKDTSTFNLFKGFFFMLISCLCRTGTSVSEKLILENNPELTPYHLNAVTSWYMMVISAIFILLSLSGFFKIDIPKKSSTAWFIILRSLMAIIVETMIVTALKFLPSSNVFSVFYLYPIVVMILTTTILGEKVSLSDIFCLPFCIVGAILVVRPKFIFTNDTLKEGSIVDEKAYLYLLILIATCAKGTGDFILRKIKNNVHFLMIPIVFSIIGTLLFPIMIKISEVPLPDLVMKQHFGIIINSVLMYGYMSFLAYALQFENASRVVMVNYLQLVFLFFIDLYVFNKPYRNLDLLGVLMIFSFNFGNAMYKTCKRIDEQEKIKSQKD